MRFTPSAGAALTLCAVSSSLTGPVAQGQQIYSHYGFDETSGTVYSDSIRGEAGAGTLNGYGTDADWGPGKVGGALRFNGSSQWGVSPVAIPAGVEEFTVSLWFFAESNDAGWGTLVKNWGSASAGAFHLGLDAESLQVSNYIGTNTSRVITPEGITTDTWNHVAVTFNSAGGFTRQRLYLNGALVSEEDTGFADLPVLGSLMSIGTKLNDAQNGPDIGWFDGSIDDLVFFTAELSPEQVSAIKTAGDEGVSAIAVIPEPSAAMLFLTAAGMALTGRRRCALTE